MKCTYAQCEEDPIRIMAYAMSDGRAMWVAPYCDEHSQEVAEHSAAIPACGPALSDEAVQIEGIR